MERDNLHELSITDTDFGAYVSPNPLRIHPRHFYFLNFLCVFIFSEAPFVL